MTTRRLRRPAIAPWRGRIGLLGLLPSAMGISVEPRQRRIYAHRLTQRSVEGPSGRSPLETGEPATRVDPAPRRARRRLERPVVGDEADQLGLRRLAPTA